MNVEQVKNIFDTLGILYKHDSEKELWMVFIDNLTFHILQKEIEDLTPEEFKSEFAQSVMHSIMDARKENDGYIVTIH